MPLFTTAVTSSSFLKNSTLMEELSSLPVQLVGKTHPGKYTEEMLISLINDYQVQLLILGLEPLSRRVVERCPSLKFVAKFGVGLDNLDTDSLSHAGIGLGWTGGVNKRSVSELVLSFALGHCRNVFGALHEMRSGIWNKSGGRLLSNTKFGIVGLGHVGSDLATLLKAFGVQVFYTDILDKHAQAKELNIEFRSYSDLLKTCDIVSFHVPSTQLTRNMFGKNQIMDGLPGLFIINTSRGDIVDFEVVTEAVGAGRLRGYASDVFPSEPIDASLWKNSPNLLFTPHIGGSAEESILAMGRSAIAHVRQFTMKNVETTP